MLAILNFLNAHYLPIFHPILVILESKFMVHRALSDKTYLSLGLLSILGIVHAHHSCGRGGGGGGGNVESCLSPIFRPFSNSHQYRCQIRLRLVDISAFSGQNRVTKMCPKYLLTRYYK